MDTLSPLFYFFAAAVFCFMRLRASANHFCPSAEWTTLMCSSIIFLDDFTKFVYSFLESFVLGFPSLNEQCGHLMSVPCVYETGFFSHFVSVNLVPPIEIKPHMIAITMTKFFMSFSFLCHHPSNQNANTDRK